MAKTSLGLENAEIERRKINLMEAMILGATGRFREAALALAGPASRTASRYSKYLSDFANNDEEGFKNTMRLCRERNIEILKANNFFERMHPTRKVRQ